MRLACNVSGLNGVNESFTLHSPILLEKGMILEYNENSYSILSINKVEFNTDGDLEGAVLILNKI